jgi:proliferating cell nuclear antigen
MFRSTISNPNLLIDSISTIAEIIDEGIFEITKEGIKLTAADRAMVAVVDFFLSSKAFDTYELDKDESLGLNIANLLSILKRAKGTDKITLSLQNNRLHIEIVNESKRRFTLPILDLTKEEVPRVDQLVFSAKTEIKPEVFQSGIDDAEIVSDAVLIKVSPSKFSMLAEGSVSRAELELEKGNASLLSLVADSEIRSRYPLDYLKKMTKAARIADTVSIALGQDYPMRLTFKAGDKCSLQFVLAPRVSEE